MLFLGVLSKEKSLLYKNTTGNDITINQISFYNEDKLNTAFINLYVSSDDGDTLVPLCKVDSPVIYNNPYSNSNPFTLSNGEGIYGISSISKVIKGFISKMQIPNGGGSGTSWSKHGVGSPVGTVIPDALDQFYRRSDVDEVYMAKGLTNADWIQIA